MHLAFPDGLTRIGRRCVLWVPRTFVPHDDVSAAVLAGRDDPLEVEVLHRVVFDVKGRPAGGSIQRWAFRDGPAGEYPVDLEPEVVVQPAGPVALDDEPQ